MMSRRRARARAHAHRQEQQQSEQDTYGLTRVGGADNPGVLRGSGLEGEGLVAVGQNP